MPPASKPRQWMRTTLVTVLTGLTIWLTIRWTIALAVGQHRLHWAHWDGSSYSCAIVSYVNPGSSSLTFISTMDEPPNAPRGIVPRHGWQLPGFEVSVFEGNSDLFSHWSANYVVRLPTPLLVLVSGLYPYIVFIRRPLRRARRRRYGLCEHCGHDLHGSTLPVCSECGERVPESSVRTLNTLLEEQRKTNDLLVRLTTERPATKRDQPVADQTSSTSGDHPS